MADTCLLTAITFAAPTRQLAARGLIAWVDCIHGAIRLKGIELRRSLQGDVTISFPPARMLNEQICCWAKPVSDSARRAIEREIIAAAMREGWL